jgi:hypothetical protein
MIQIHHTNNDIEAIAAKNVLNTVVTVHTVFKMSA